MRKRILVLGGNSGVVPDLLGLLGMADVFLPRRSDADLTSREETERLFRQIRPDEVYCLAARTAGPKDHQREPWGLLRDNLRIQLCVLDACAKYGCKKLLWFASDSALPYYEDSREVTEEDLFSGEVKGDIESYAEAKLAGIRMCRDLSGDGLVNAVSLLPCNIYGRVKKGLMYDLCRDFLMARHKEERRVTVWGGQT